DIFYRQELRMREQLGYPPYGHLLKVTLAGQDTRRLEREARRIKHWMQTRAPDDAIFLGPVVTDAGGAGSHAQLLVKLPRLILLDEWRAAGWLDFLRDPRAGAIALLDTADFVWTPATPEPSAV
ncbi:MAG: hypothetical protein ACREJQ_08780, partial [bacterium]